MIEKPVEVPGAGEALQVEAPSTPMTDKIVKVLMAGEALQFEVSSTTASKKIGQVPHGVEVPMADGPGRLVGARGFSVYCYTPFNMQIRLPI